MEVTKKDLDQLEKRIDKGFDKVDKRFDAVDKRFDAVITGNQKAIDYAVGQLKDEMNEKISNLPTKDDFFNVMDELMGELKSNRQEHAVQGHQIADLEMRVTRLEKAS